MLVEYIIVNNTTTTTSSSTTTTTTTTSLAPVYTKFALEVANSPNTATNGRRLRTSIAPGTMIVSITGPPGQSMQWNTGTFCVDDSNRLRSKAAIVYIATGVNAL